MSIPAGALSPSFVTALAAFVANYADGNLDADGVAVVSLEEESYDAGYCETCSYEDTYCKLTYKVNGEVKILEVTESFAELIKTLTYDYK
jgi:hypothetical protein